jgi:4-hydroxy-3-methylbut-2-enyl diphosphate reductase
MKKFDIPGHFRSGSISRIKDWQKIRDPRKQDFAPTILDFGALHILLPRHFGFCYGVENAIEISYQALRDNPGKRIFLLSQMIHNPHVNEDLEAKGIGFIMDTEGNQLIPWTDLHAGDIVIIPAFGTTIEIETLLRNMGVDIEKYNTTCPFVEKVWKRSAEIGHKGYSVVIHGKHKHEETRATFSHGAQHAPSVIIRDMTEAQLLAEYMLGNKPGADFATDFKGKYSNGFDPYLHLKHIGVVNQTTMLASETQEISDFLKSVIREKYGDNWKQHFADTRDTLCYATNDNQESTRKVLDFDADLAIVIGGFNSSNTAQLVTILESRMPTYFIQGVDDLINQQSIRHGKYGRATTDISQDWLPAKSPLKIVLTSGASCPDSEVEAVLDRIIGFFPNSKEIEKVIGDLVEK